MLHRRYIVWAAVVVAGLALVLAAPAAAQTTVKRASGLVVTDFDGHKLYDTYCAACHGSEGKGDGLAVEGLQEAVPDLTLIAVRDGKFIPLHVMAHVTEAHGGLEGMPDEGNLFLHSCGGADKAHLAAANLTRHIQAMQAARR